MLATATPFLAWVLATATPFLTWCDLPGHQWAVAFGLAWTTFLMVSPLLVICAALWLVVVVSERMGKAR